MGDTVFQLIRTQHNQILTLIEGRAPRQERSRKIILTGTDSSLRTHEKIVSDLYCRRQRCIGLKEAAEGRVILWVKVRWKFSQTHVNQVHCGLFCQCLKQLRNDGESNNAMKFAFWKGPGEWSSGYLNGEDVSNKPDLVSQNQVRSGKSPQKVSVQGTESHQNGGSRLTSHLYVPTPLTRQQIFPAVSYGRASVVAMAPEGQAGQNSVGNGPFRMPRPEPELAIRGKRKRRIDLAQLMGTFRPMPIAAEVGEAASMGRLLAPRQDIALENRAYNLPLRVHPVLRLESRRAESHSNKRKSRFPQSNRPVKRNNGRLERSEDEQSNGLRDALQWLEDEFEE